MTVPPIGPPQTTLATVLTAQTFLQGLGMALPEAGVAPTEVLRTALVSICEDSSLRESLDLSDDLAQDLTRFAGGDDEEPSQRLLEALHAKTHDVKAVLNGLHPDLFAGAAEPGTTTGRIERTALQYPETTDEARSHHDENVRQAVDRMLAGIHDRARTSMVATPKAISLTEVLENPQPYRDKPLEVVLFDVDGTTHKGDTIFEGQYSIEWLLRDILRYGPKNTAGIGWWRLLKAIPSIVRLRLQEKKNGEADKTMFQETFGRLLKGLDGKRAEESLRRFYDRYGSRGVSEFMRDEFIRHRQANRLIIGVSASHEFLVKMHAKRDMGIPEENMLGTTIEIDPDTNRATGTFRWLHGEDKVAALEEEVFGPLRERGIRVKLVAGYSDSPSDRPMLGLVKKDGGVIFSTNASKEAFKTEVLADGGMDVEEIYGWLDNGVRRLTFASSQTGKFVHEEATPPRRPAWAGDVAKYSIRTATDAAGFALAAPVSEAVGQALQHGGHVDWSLNLMATMPSMAVAGFFASAATLALVPPDGPVSWQRRVLMRGMIPVASAMAAAGSTGGIGFWATMAVAMVASAGVELATFGERSVGLRRWRGGEERKNLVAKTVGFFGLRSLQSSAFRALSFFLQRLAGA